MAKVLAKNRIRQGAGTYPPHATRSRKVNLVTGHKSLHLLRAPLDGRTRAGQAHHRYVQELQKHLGGDISMPEGRLADQAARLALLAELCFQELRLNGLFADGTPRPAVDAFMRASAQEREVLRMLGLKRAAKPILNLQEYLQSRSMEDAELGEDPFSEGK